MPQNNPSNKEDDRFSITCRVADVNGQGIETVLRDITVEQTVEIPFGCIPDNHHKQGITGRVESCKELDRGIFQAEISYRTDITGNVPQFLNVVFGNISLKREILITDINIPPSMKPVFGGPGWGIDNIRKLTGVFERPLSCSALKPLGTGSEKLASMAEAYSLGGIDLIKDDHGLTDQHFHPFGQRVALCSEAIERANCKTGRKTLYFPNVSGSFSDIEKQVRLALKHGIKGVLVAPMLVGLDMVRYLSQTYKIIIMAHPSFTGTFFSSKTHGMTPAVLLGKIFRWIGSDISIFPNWGGRFPFTRQECMDLALALQAKSNDWQSAFPCPAGGMALDKLESMAQAYGKDSIFLIGGALMQHSTDLIKSSSLFMEKLGSLFKPEYCYTKTI